MKESIKRNALLVWCLSWYGIAAFTVGAATATGAGEMSWFAWTAVVFALVIHGFGVIAEGWKAP